MLVGSGTRGREKWLFRPRLALPSRSSSRLALAGTKPLGKKELRKEMKIHLMDAVAKEKG